MKAEFHLCYRYILNNTDSIKEHIATLQQTACAPPWLCAFTDLYIMRIPPQSCWYQHWRTHCGCQWNVTCWVRCAHRGPPRAPCFYPIYGWALIKMLSIYSLFTAVKTAVKRLYIILLFILLQCDISSHPRWNDLLECYIAKFICFTCMSWSIHLSTSELRNILPQFIVK